LYWDEKIDYGNLTQRSSYSSLNLSFQLMSSRADPRTKDSFAIIMGTKQQQPEAKK